MCVSWTKSAAANFSFFNFLSLCFYSPPPFHSKAEARLAAKRAARAEAREIRMKELERQQKEVYKSKYPMTCDTRYGIIQNFMLGQICKILHL